MNEFQFHRAREFLTWYMLKQASRLSRDLGISYEPVDEAPETYEALLTEYAAARRESRGLRVYAGASTNTIYLSAEANWAFRFVHDIGHIVYKLDFSVGGEIALAERHIADLLKQWPSAHAAAAVLRADTVGQVEYYEEHGSHVENQLDFVRSKVVHG